MRKVFYPIWEKISPEDRQKMRSIGPHDGMYITPDGAYYDNSKNLVINFYTGNMPEDALSKAIEGIHYYLKEMNVKYGPFKNEKSAMYGASVIRIPVLQIQTTKNVPSQLNLSNSNAFLIFHDVLGYEESEFYDIPVTDILFKIGNLPDYAPELHQRDPYSTKGKGAMMHYGGLAADGIKDRLAQIKNIALWAQQNGYDKLTVS